MGITAASGNTVSRINRLPDSPVLIRFKDEIQPDEVVAIWNLGLDQNRRLNQYRISLTVLKRRITDAPDSQIGQNIFQPLTFSGSELVSS